MSVQRTDEISSALSARVCEVRGRARTYVLSRQSSAGGFCFYRYGPVDEPNVRDTYSALESLELLDIPVPESERTIEFLTHARLWGPAYLYDCVCSLELLGATARISAETLMKIEALKVICAPADRYADFGAWLESTYRIIRLKKHLLAASDGTQRHEDVLEILERWAVRPGASANLFHAYNVIRIATLLGAPLVLTGINALVESVERLPFGFAVTADSNSPRLDVVFAGVECCRMLGMPVKHSREALEFALSCQMAGGGFANAPVALPNLETTHQGLAVLSALSPA